MRVLSIANLTLYLYTGTKGPLLRYPVALLFKLIEKRIQDLRTLLTLIHICMYKQKRNRRKSLLFLCVNLYTFIEIRANIIIKYETLIENF